MLRRSLVQRNKVYRLSDIPSLINATTLPERFGLAAPGTVVLTRRAALHCRASAIDKARTDLRSPVDYYSALQGKIPWVGQSRRRVDAFVSHSPLLLGASQNVVVTFPKDDQRIGASQLQPHELVSRQAPAVLKVIQERCARQGEWTGYRNGALCQLRGQLENTNVQLHLHQQFDGPEQVLEYLRSLGHYIPCVHFRDDLYFGQDLVDAITHCRVTIDPAYGCTDRHVRSIRELWDLGFDLELKGLSPAQLPRLRTAHGLPEAFLIGQQLRVQYDNVIVEGASENSNKDEGVMLEAKRLDLVPLPSEGMDQEATFTEPTPTQCVHGLLRGQSDFPQKLRDSRHGDWPELLNTVPQYSEAELVALFVDLETQIGETADAEQRRRKPETTFTALVQQVQRLCCTADVRHHARLALDASAPLCEKARDVLRDPKSKPRERRVAIDQAADHYTLELAAQLNQCLATAKAQVVEHYHKVLMPVKGRENKAKEESFVAFAMPKPSGASPHFPFYDGVLKK